MDKFIRPNSHTITLKTWLKCLIYHGSDSFEIHGSVLWEVAPCKDFSFYWLKSEATSDVSIDCKYVEGFKDGIRRSTEVPIIVSKSQEATLSK